MTGSGRRVPVGRIVGVHGVRGEVKIESWTEPRERIFEYQPWLLLPAPGRESEVRGATGGSRGKGMWARLPGIDDREAAAALIGADILIDRDLLPPPEQGEYYWTDLEGLEVVDVSGKVLGRVHHLFGTGANDVMVVRGGEREHLVPFVTGPFVKSVDVDAGRIVVDWDGEF
jgi:16S rRNA processing protein RimM